jgi:hypothetical protein
MTAKMILQISLAVKGMLAVVYVVGLVRVGSGLLDRTVFNCSWWIGECRETAVEGAKQQYLWKGHTGRKGDQSSHHTASGSHLHALRHCPSLPSLQQNRPLTGICRLAGACLTSNCARHTK